MMKNAASKVILTIFGWAIGLTLSVATAGAVIFLIISMFVALFNGGDFMDAMQRVWASVFHA